MTYRHRKRNSGPLWAITSYFNPFSSRRRYLNYRAFRAHLSVPLVTVELGYGPYELSGTDADVLIQIEGRDRIWQKERLLNVALTKLPADCQMVAWLDCDIVFTDAEWPTPTRKALQKWPIVQPFFAVYQGASFNSDGPLPPPEHETSASRSLASRMLDGSVPISIFGTTGSSRRFGYQPGYAWAARRDVLEQEGLYDAFAIGCGDKAIASAAYGRFADTVQAYRLSEAHAEHYCSWARRFYRRVGGRVGFVNCGLVHLWHGDPAKRARRATHDILRRFDFSPEEDLAVAGGGAWRWASAKPEMHRYVNNSLRDRCPDCDD